VDLLVSSEVSRVSGGDERCPVAQAVKFAGIEKSLSELRSGRMIVIADDADRENEGDLMIAAEMVTQLYGYLRAGFDLSRNDR
jgi:3,4-dihydroxy-2-butanone 4-phosphate synthase